MEACVQRLQTPQPAAEPAASRDEVAGDRNLVGAQVPKPPSAFRGVREHDVGAVAVSGGAGAARLPAARVPREQRALKLFALVEQRRDERAVFRQALADPFLDRDGRHGRMMLDLAARVKINDARSSDPLDGYTAPEVNA